MEQMVTDVSVGKVIMVCDRKYTDKANARKGGVGAESQIISPELYGKGSQDKFAAVITEVDGDGNPYVPAFYKGRIHFDFSSDENFDTQYEALLRWLLDKPLKIKPEIGTVPSHISDVTIRAPATDARYRRADAAVRQGQPSAMGFVREFSDTLVDEFEGLRIVREDDTHFDDQVIQSLRNARPYVQQVQGLVSSLARYSHDIDLFCEFLRILERLARFMTRPEHITYWNEDDFDNFKCLCHELFISCLAILLKEERFDFADQMISHAYFIESVDSGEGSTKTFNLFRPVIRTFDIRKQRLQLNSSSLHATYINELYAKGNPNMADLMQADFILYLRDAIRAVGNGVSRDWYPVTLHYAANRHRPFSIFARAESASYFNRIRGLIGTKSKEDLKSSLTEIVNTEWAVPRFGYFALPIATLSNVAQIGTRD
jgi:hypothetical protein